MEKDHNDVSKFAIANSSEFGLSMASHFSPVHLQYLHLMITWISSILVNQVVMTLLSHYIKKF